MRSGAVSAIIKELKSVLLGKEPEMRAESLLRYPIAWGIRGAL
jgi:hypothetical protein